MQKTTTDERIENMDRFLKSSRGLQGAIVEVGVWRGGSLRILAERNPDRFFSGFDTFAGMPTESARDNTHKAGDFGDTSFDQVSRDLGDLGNVVLIQGEYPGSDPTEFPIVLAHVDVDLFSSTLNAFRHLRPRMVPGGRIYCDDAFQPTCDGATLAVCTFAHETDLVPRLDPTSHVFFQF